MKTVYHFASVRHLWVRRAPTGWVCSWAMQEMVNAYLTYYLGCKRWYRWKEEAEIVAEDGFPP